MKTFDSILDSWHAVARRHASEWALVEMSSGRMWTFSDLYRAGQNRAESIDRGSVMHPTGEGAGFIIDVLGAWERGVVICPAESGMEKPAAAWWDGIAEAHPGVVLAKTTSGSTGTPRHVLFSATALTADVSHIVSTMGLDRSWPNIGAISLAHSYGFANLVLPLVLHGHPLRLAASPLPEAVRAALAWRGDGSRVILPGVPALWHVWHGAGLVTPRVAVAISAGAPLPLELERDVFAATGVKIHNFLGSTECGGIAYDRSSVPRASATLVGTAMDGVRLTADGDSVLVVESNAVGDGYWPAGVDDEPERPRLGGGLFRTGDLAEQKDDGWHVLGRVADTINVAGRKVHPGEIEQRLRRHPAVAECLVFGVPSADPTRGEEIVACVAIDGSDGDLVALQSWLNASGPAWQSPRHWWWCPDLAADARGKLSRRAWRAAFLRSHRSR